MDKTLTKGLQLLESLSRSERARGVSELAAELALTKSNVHRLLQSLTSCGFVSRERGGDRYVLTSKLWRLSRLQRPHRALLDLVHPSLSELVAETGETASFAIVEGDDVVMIDQVETPHTVRVFYAIGDAHPLDHVLLSGKGLSALQQVAFAFRPDLEVQRALQTVGRELAQPASYVAEQLARIRKVREQGFALSRGEWVEGVNAVAAPVAGRAGDLIGILVSFGPAHRLPDPAIAAVRQATCAAAKTLAARLD